MSGIAGSRRSFAITRMTNYETNWLQQTPHRRFNPLLREWVLVSPHRTSRPWQGKVERAGGFDQPQYDPDCYLCPGNERVGGKRNPTYENTFVFENDFAALMPEIPEAHQAEAGLLSAKTERGICRVVCFSPRHDLTMARMSQPELRKVVDVWTGQFTELSAVPWIQHVQIFENRGALMGASNPHPHGQIWANASVPNVVQREIESMKEYLAKNQSCLLCDYTKLELEKRERVVCENEGFVALVPYWAVWPFETMVLSKRHVASLEEFSPDERDQFADILRRLTIRYDNLFETSFPYSMGFHQKPTDRHAHPECHFHAHFLPPLLRSATVQKFVVGYELLASPQRDITPENAAARLTELSERHFLDR